MPPQLTAHPAEPQAAAEGKLQLEALAETLGER